jgi:hypothetical protein
MEHQEVVVGRRAAGWVAVGAGELEVVGRTGLAQHHAVEAVVVLEAGEHAQAQAVAVEGQERVEVGGRTRMTRCEPDIDLTRAHLLLVLRHAVGEVVVVASVRNEDVHGEPGADGRVEGAYHDLDPVQMSGIEEQR